MRYTEQQRLEVKKMIWNGTNFDKIAEITSMDKNSIYGIRDNGFVNSYRSCKSQNGVRRACEKWSVPYDAHETILSNYGVVPRKLSNGLSGMSGKKKRFDAGVRFLFGYVSINNLEKEGLTQPIISKTIESDEFGKMIERKYGIEITELPNIRKDKKGFRKMENAHAVADILLNIDNAEIMKNESANHLNCSIYSLDIWAYALESSIIKKFSFVENLT